MLDIKQFIKKLIIFNIISFINYELNNIKNNIVKILK